MFDWLASEAPTRSLVWDAGCGNGQASVALAERFERVYATDPSAKQIENAEAKANIDYRVEPDGDCIDITAVHKGGLFGSDYRMLFPGDGTDGIKRFVIDTIASFHRRGLACPPAIVGVGIGGTKDQCFTLSKEACQLRVVGDRHPDPVVAELEDELVELCNRTSIGVMGLKSDTAVVDVHCEIAYTHTGGTPVGVSELCTAVPGWSRGRRRTCSGYGADLSGANQ